MRYLVYLMTDDESRTWLLKPVMGEDELSAIKVARVKTSRADYKIRAFPKGSPEAKEAHKKIKGRIPGHVYVAY